MREVERAMVLAAGFGTRLRPVTDHLPKPLLPLLGLPLVEIVIHHLLTTGIHEIALNSHHLAEPMARWVEEWNAGIFAGGGEADGVTRCALTLFHEPAILGTGGALTNARTWLEQDDMFLLYNGDVLTDLDLAALMADHRQNAQRDAHGCVATLALVDYPPINTVLLASDGAVLDLAGRLATPPRTSCASLTYTGIAIMSRDIFQHLPPTGFASLVDALLKAILQRPGSVRGWVPPQAYWNDLGTVGRYLDAHHHVLVDRLLVPAGMKPPLQPTYRDGRAVVASNAQLYGFTSLNGDCQVGPDARLQDCVVLAGAQVAAGSRHHRAIIGPDWVAAEEEPGSWQELAVTGLLDLDLVQQAGFTATARAHAITGHGSDRRFWRLASGDRTAVLMRTTPDDPEYRRLLDIGDFLVAENLGGPRILDRDPATCAVLLEDLGEDSLYRLAAELLALPPGGGRQDHTANPEVAALYRPVLQRLVQIQTLGTALLERCPAAGDRRLDYETLRWETDYFRKYFLERIAEISAGELPSMEPGELTALDDEFHLLAQATLTQPVVLMHRDFQSQNIFLINDRVRLVDFQGMRQGPLAYDLMSLLRDSYVDLGAALREELMNEYRHTLAESGGIRLSKDDLAAMATVAGLQRNMQSLGAFGYLSLVKGKAQFRQYIPLGVQHLAEGLQELQGGDLRMPRLEQLVAGLGMV